MMPAPATPLTPSCVFGAFGAPTLVTGLGVDANLYGPVLSADGTTLFFAANTGLTEQVYRGRRNAGASFGLATPVTELNTLGLNGTPFLSADSLAIYFFSTRPGGPGNRDIWLATRPNTGGEFSLPVLVPVINGANLDHHPWLDDAHDRLMFVSSRLGGAGGSDFWVSELRGPKREFSPPVNLSSLNTPSLEEGLALSADGLTAFFASDRAGLGLDLWTATRPTPTGNFAAATLLAGLNSTSDDLDPALSSGERELFFSSSRSGKSEIWLAVRECL
jgi:Tol biopolymer transport system component